MKTLLFIEDIILSFTAGLLNILESKTVRLLALAVLIVGLVATWGATYRPANAEDTPPPAASAALLEIQRIAPTYDAWKAEEEKWNKAKQIITEVYGCTIAADRSAIDCSSDFQ
jgi:hypothetical protein